MSSALARKFRIDVTNDLTLTSGFVQLNGVSDFDPGIAAHMEDARAYDTNGLPSMEVTAYDGAPTATFFRRFTGATEDPGQAIVRGATLLQYANAARIGFRWYDKTGGPEAGSAVVIPTWRRANTGVLALEQAQVTFQVTDGILNYPITNPYAAAAIPVVTAVTPTAQNSGKIVNIVGTGFTGATAVTAGGVAVSSYIVQSDNLITAVLNTAGAGSAPIVVTNPIGASTPSFPYTRGA